MKISGIYKITNTITNDCYIGSSKNLEQRLASHKCPSIWNRHPNNQLYQDMQKYGVDKFDFQILANVEPEQLKEAEQQFIETLKPTYNDRNAHGWNIERYKEPQKKASRKYGSQLCCYNCEALTLNTLSVRFKRAGIPHPVLEAKKYLLVK